MAPTRPTGQRGRPKEAAPANPSASPFVQRIEALINGSSKTQRQHAAELGYDKPNIITMFKDAPVLLEAFDFEGATGTTVHSYRTGYNPRHAGPHSELG